MSSNHQQRQVIETADRDRFGIDPEILVSLAVVPSLLALVAIEKLSEGLAAIGTASEEVFRGDRLPVLHFPETSPDGD